MKKRKTIKTILSSLIFILTTIYIVYAAVGPVEISTPANGTWDADGNITFTCNATASTDFNVTNVTLYVWNESDSYTLYNTSINTSVGSNGTAVTRTFFVPNIPELEGLNYTWGCYAEESNSSGTTYTNWSLTNNTFGVDISAPVVNLVGPANDTTDYDTVLFTYNVTDNASTPANCSIYFDGALSTTNTSPAKGGTNLTFSTNPPGSDNLEWSITCYDQVGNEGNSSTYRLDTYTPPSKSGSGGYNGRDYTITSLSQYGNQERIKAKDRIHFSYGGDDHTITISYVNDEYVTLTVASTPTTAKIEVGSSDMFDLNDDGTDDLEIVVDSVLGSYADITVTQLSNTISSNCVEDWYCGPWGECINGVRERTCTDNNNCTNSTNIPATSESCNEPRPTKLDIQQKSPINSSTWMIAGIIVIAGAVFAWTFNKKKR